MPLSAPGPQTAVYRELGTPLLRTNTAVSQQPAQHRGSRGPRPWSIPPTPTRRRNEVLPATEILTELEGKLAVLLWLLLRDVELWTSMPARRRGDLFRLAALARLGENSLPDVLAGDVRTLATVLAGGVGKLEGRAAEARASAACSRVSAWAGDRARYTALYFAHAAAALDFRSGALAREVARCAARCAEIGYAESWLRRAVALARRGRDWMTYTRAIAELGELFEARGDVAGARAAFVRAARACRRYSLGADVRAQIAVGRFRVALRAGDAAETDYFQRAALRTHARRAPGAAAVRQVLARALFEHGHYRSAIRMLGAADPAAADAATRLAGATLLARAAAAADDAPVLERAWAAAVEIIEAHVTGADRSRQLLQFAQDVLSALPSDAVGAAAAGILDRVADLHDRAARG